MLKAEHPRSRGERRCYICQRVFTGRSTHCRQDSELCESCHTRWECGFVGSPYIYASQRHYRERISPIRQAAPRVTVRNKGPMLPKVHQPSATFADTICSQHQTTLRNFSKCAIENCSNFCYERKETGEPCVLQVSQLGATELVWGHNGIFIHCGQENCMELSASHQTEGIYLCYKEGTDVLLLAHVICLKEEEKGCQPQPVGGDKLLLAPNLDCLSCACSDNNPALCPQCTRRGTIFLNAGKVTVLSPVLGETVTVDASVCPHEINKFHFIWHQDSVKLPYENHLSYTIRASKSSFCMCIAVNLSSGKELYSSEVFSVEPTGYPSSTPLTDPTVRQEVTPSYRHGVNTQPSASQLAGTASSVSSQLNLLRPPGPTLTPFGQPEEGRHSVINPSPMVLSPVYWSNLTVRPAAVNSVHHPPQSVPDTERPSRPSESFQVEDFLIYELVQSDIFNHPHFNLSLLADSPTCCPCIRDIIQREMSLPCISERHTMENVVRRISQDTTLDAIGIRRCVALMYMLICSLQDDKQNAYHQSLGTHLMQKAPFPPMLLSWSPGPSWSLPRGEYVTLSVTACNADRFNWICNRSRSEVPFVCHSGSSYRFPVDPSTCGVYQCSVGNRHSWVQTPPTEISMSDEAASSSSTEAMYGTTYKVAGTPEPYTSLEVASVEDQTAAIGGGHEVLVSGILPPSRFLMEQLVPGAVSSNDSRGLMMLPTGYDQYALHQYIPREGLLFDPPLPHAHSSVFRPADSKPQ